MLHYHNNPDMPPIPQGWVLLGRGDEFIKLSGEREFQGKTWEPQFEEEWGEEMGWRGNDSSALYIAPANSEIVRINVPNWPDGYTCLGHGVTSRQVAGKAFDISNQRWILDGSDSEFGGSFPHCLYFVRENQQDMTQPIQAEAPVQRAVRQWDILIGNEPTEPSGLVEDLLPFLEDATNAAQLAADLDEASRRSDPEVSIEHWIDVEPSVMAMIEFVPLANSGGVDIQAIAESNAAISDVIIKAAAGVMLRGGLSDHFRYLEDGTLVIDPSSPPSLDQAYEMLKRTLETKETASKLENYSAWMLGMIADQFEGFFQDRFDPSIIMAQTSRAYNTYICSLKTFRAWWNDRREGLTFTHHREVEYAKHLDHETGGAVLDLSQKFGLTVLQQRKLISYAKRFDIAALEAEMAEAGQDGVDDLMERIDIRAVNKRYLFFLRTANRWYEYKGPFENIPNGASPIINVDSRQLMAQDGRATKPDEWVPVGVLASPEVLAEVGADVEDEEDNLEE
jgi:hypothetical protein